MAALIVLPDFLFPPLNEFSRQRDAFHVCFFVWALADLVSCEDARSVSQWITDKTLKTGFAKLRSLLLGAFLIEQVMAFRGKSAFSSVQLRENRRRRF